MDDHILPSLTTEVAEAAFENSWDVSDLLGLHCTAMPNQTVSGEVVKPVLGAAQSRRLVKSQPLHRIARKVHNPWLRDPNRVVAPSISGNQMCHMFADQYDSPYVLYRGLGWLTATSISVPLQNRRSWRRSQLQMALFQGFSRL